MNPRDFFSTGEFVNVYTAGGAVFKYVRVTGNEDPEVSFFDDEGTPLIVKTSAITAIEYA